MQIKPEIIGRTVLGKTLREHVGGRWAISLLFYLINFPINLITLGSNMTVGVDGNLPKWLAIGVLGYAGFGVVLLLANFTLFRNRRIHSVPIAWVIALGVVAGGTRGLLVGSLADSWQVSGGATELILVRTATGAVLGGVFIPIAALIISVISTYLKNRTELVRHLAQLRISRMRASGESQALRETLFSDAATQISNAASARAVSHQVWPKQKQAPRQRVPWFMVIRTVVLRNPYPGLIVAILWSISALGSLIPAVGVANGIAQIIFSAIAIWLIYQGASRVSFANEFASLLWFVFVMAFTVMVTGPIASIIFDDRPMESGLALILANSVWLPTLTIFVSIFRGALASTEAIMQELKNRIRSEEVSTLAAEEERMATQREVAEAIHGMASRIHTSQASTGLDQVLNFDDLMAPSTDLGTPTEIIDSALASWSSLMNFTLDISLGDCDSQCAVMIKKVIQEGLANAYRHGKADQCSITIHVDSDWAKIEITDNGRGIANGHTPGLGSAILDSVCGNQWSLRPAVLGGCTIKAKVKVP